MNFFPSNPIIDHLVTMFSKVLLLAVATASIVSAQTAAYGQCEILWPPTNHENTDICKVVAKGSVDLRLACLVGLVPIQTSGTLNVFLGKVSL